MSERRKTWVLLAVVAVLGAVGLLAYLNGRQPDGGKPVADGNGEHDTSVADGPGVTEKPPIWDLPPDKRPEGAVKPWRKDANAMTASVAEALDTNTHPERVSLLFEPEAFELAKFQAEPQKYLNTVEPGRVWQVAQPGESVPRIASLSSLTQAVDPGESVVLKVKVPAGMPVTFTSFDLGAFENLLTSISVKAGEDGIAQASFTASSGTIGTVNILAGSPVTSGQLRYMVYIAEKPNTAISSTAR